MSWLGAIFNGVFFVLAIWVLWLFGLQVVIGGFKFFLSQNQDNPRPWAIAALILSALTLAALAVKGVVLK